MQKEKKLNLVITLLSLIFITSSINAQNSKITGDNNFNNSISFSTQLKSPKIILANNESVIQFNSTTPTFEWEKVENANGYTIYINKITGEEEENVFISSEYGTITLTEFTVPTNILEPGVRYSITLRAFNLNGWSDYSNKIFFNVEKILPGKILETVDLSVPKIITKNYLKIDTLQNKQLQYSLAWNRTINAELYQIVMEGINTNSIFGEEYLKLVSTSVRDTSYYLKPEMFIDFINYRWKIRSKNSQGWSSFSPFYYFNFHNNDSFNKETTDELEEIIMRLKYSSLIDEMVIAKFKNGKTLLPINEILSLFQFPHKLDYENKNLSGSRLDEDKLKYNLNISEHKLFLGNEVIQFSDENIFETELDYFIDKNLIEMITGMNVDIDMRNLTVRISSNFILPIYQRILNEQNLELYKNSLHQNESPIEFKRKRNYLSGGFFDYSTTANYVKLQSPYYSTQFGLGLELLGGDAQINSQQSIQQNKLIYNQTSYKWRYAFLNNKYISNISLGNNSAFGLESYSFRGIQISNEPIEARRLYGNYKIEEKTYPNWKVEIYINNRLVDIVNADDNGNYDFLIPFGYGTTIIELHQFGPNGEYNIESKMYQIPIEQIPEGKLDYSINFGELVNQKKNIFQSYAAYGVNNWLTTKIGADLFTDDFSYSSIYSNTTARLLNGYILNLTLAPNAFNEFSVNSIFSDLASFNLGAKFYQNNLKLNPSKTKYELEGNIFLPINLNDNMMSLLLRGRQTEYLKSKRYDLSLRTFYNYRNFSPSIEFDYSNLHDFRNRNIESAFINLRLNYSFYITSRIISGNIIDTRFVYDILDNKTESMSISFSTTLFQKFRVQLSQNVNFNNSYSDTQLRVVFDLPFFRSNTNISKTVVSQSFIGSINYNQILKDFNFYNRGMIGRSAATFQFFLDKNMNQYLDEGENLVPDMDILINSIGNKRKLDEGQIIINDLESYSKYDVKLINKNSKNPLWFPYKENFSFTSDPHQYKQIAIPFYEAAEINGSVMKKIGNNLIPVSGININFELKETKNITTVKTMSDGSFYYYGMRPGDYNISIDHDQLQRLRLKAAPEKIDTLIRSISTEENAVEYKFILK